MAMGLILIFYLLTIFTKIDYFIIPALLIMGIVILKNIKENDIKRKEIPILFGVLAVILASIGVAKENLLLLLGAMLVTSHAIYTSSNNDAEINKS